MFEIAARHRKKWDRAFGPNQPISLVPVRRGNLAGRGIFAIGSCFALEVRHRLAERGLNTYPKYFDIQFDPAQTSVGRLPERDNINHYSVASILQEFRNALAPSPIYTSDLFFDLSSKDKVTTRLKRNLRSILGDDAPRFEANWQDPFRKQVFAADCEALQAVSESITDKIREGLHNADVFIVTLGMTETWVEKRGGLTVCNSYGGKVDEHLCYFHDLSFTETKAKIADVVTTIRQVRPKSDIVFTVSPVSLARTAKDQSLVSANNSSKAKQRAAVDEVCAEMENVFYFPSFEMQQDPGFFVRDGRHVHPDKIDHIVDSFLRWYQG